MKNKHLYKTLTILALTLATATGCGKNDDTVASPQAPSENIASTQEAAPSADADTAPAADTASEKEAAKATEAADTPSETAETTGETKTAENIREIIKNLDLTKYENSVEGIEDLKKYKTPMLMVWHAVYIHDSAKKRWIKQILVDGDSYTYDDGDCLIINRSPLDGNIKGAYIALEEGDIYAIITRKSCGFPLEPSYADGLYTFVVEYTDGTKDEMTIDITFSTNTQSN